MAATEPLFFADRHEWGRWLEQNHATEKEAWVVHYKKGKSAGVTYFEALEEALCFGWIDGKLKGIDNEKFMLRYTPRNPKSVWSQGNKEKAEVLIASGQMAPAGLASVEAAKKSGRWDSAYIDRSEVDTPLDLKDALSRNPDAQANF